MREAPVRLRCEYLDEPLGIDTDRPRLSWWLNDTRDAELQTAYQVQAATAPSVLESGGADLWDTGYVPSQQTVNVEYRGRTLWSGARVWWRVRCYDSDGTASPWSRPARFEIGLLEDGQWHGQWIAAPLSGSPATAVPAPLVYRDFELRQRPAAARLYVAVLGAALVEINGGPVAEAEPLAPWTDVRHRVPYRVWDVTALLRQGPNRLAAILGDGDYCGHVNGGPRQRFGTRPALLAQLAVDLDGGGHLVVASDLAWRWCPSWVLRADRDGGEEVDGRQWVPGWSRPGSPAHGAPVVETRPALTRFAGHAAPVRVNATLDAVTPLHRVRADDGRLRVDFGRSVLGRVRVELEASPGTTVTVRYGESVPSDGGTSAPSEGGTSAPSDGGTSAPSDGGTSAPTDGGTSAPSDGGTSAAASVRWLPATDRYTARGDGVEVFEPRFAIHAFRWIEIAGDREPFEVRAAKAVEVASAAPSTAAFRCDEPLLEDLFAAADRTLHLGLTLGPVHALAVPWRRTVITDAEAIVAGTLCCRDAAGALRGWLEDLAAADDVGSAAAAGLDDGVEDDGAELGSLLECLWLAYRSDGDRRLLERLFPSARRGLAGLEDRWPALIRGRGGARASPRRQLLATAWYCRALVTAARLAGVLGRLEDLERYETRARRVAKVFRARFLSAEGLLLGDEPLGHLLALELGLLEGQERAAALGRLDDQLRDGTLRSALDVRHGALLLQALTQAGRPDLACRVLLETPRGWLQPSRADTGVLWDARRGLPGRLAAAGVLCWLQRSLLGLAPDAAVTPDQNAYRRARVQPHPPLGPAFAGGLPLHQVSGHLDTVHGRYQCAWRVDDEAFTLWVRVPGNCGARVILPDASEHLVSAGGHRFQIPRRDLPASVGAVRDAAADDIPVLREVSSEGGF